MSDSRHSRHFEHSFRMIFGAMAKMPSGGQHKVLNALAESEEPDIHPDDIADVLDVFYPESDAKEKETS